MGSTMVARGAGNQQASNPTASTLPKAYSCQRNWPLFCGFDGLSYVPDLKDLRAWPIGLRLFSVTIADIEQAIGNDQNTPLTLVLESGQQLTLVPENYGKTNNGKRLFITVGDDRYAIVETDSVKTIVK
jgi:hypothetical protein